MPYLELVCHPKGVPQITLALGSINGFQIPQQTYTWRFEHPSPQVGTGSGIAHCRTAGEIWLFFGRDLKKETQFGTLVGLQFPAAAGQEFEFIIEGRSGSTTFYVEDVFLAGTSRFPPVVSNRITKRFLMA